MLPERNFGLTRWSGESHENVYNMMKGVVLVKGQLVLTVG